MGERRGAERTSAPESPAESPGSHPVSQEAAASQGPAPRSAWPVPGLVPLGPPAAPGVQGQPAPGSVGPVPAGPQPCVGPAPGPRRPGPPAARAPAGSRRPRSWTEAGAAGGPGQGRSLGFPGTPAPPPLLNCWGSRSLPPGGRAEVGGWAWGPLAHGTPLSSPFAEAGEGGSFLSGWGLHLAARGPGEVAQQAVTEGWRSLWTHAL